MIAAGDVPETIAGKRVMVLDLSGMVAGSKYRGEFEERIKNVVSEVTNSGTCCCSLTRFTPLSGQEGRRAPWMPPTFKALPGKGGDPAHRRYHGQ